jgi:hypothetical protein
MIPEPIAVTLKVTEVLEQLDIPYLLSDSFASAIHGVVRTTQDSDILAKMGEEHIEAFIQALETEFYLDDQMISREIRQNDSFNILHRDSMFKVDVFVSRRRPFDQAQLSRAQPQQLVEGSPVQAMVCTAEDIILAKLEWFQMGGEVSERQWRDIIGILKVQDDRLDFPYLHRWAAELGVSDLLEQALQAS